MNAISLNGTTQYLSLPNFSALDGLTDYTLEFWVKNTATSEAYDTIASINSVSAYFMYFVTENGVGNQGFNFATNYAGSNADGYEADARLIQETWTQVSIVHNNTLNKTSVFINGVENNGYNLQATGTSTLQDSSGMDLTLGHELTDTKYFNGDIGGYVRLWNRALTGAEIYYNYNKTLTPANEDSSLIVNCNFSEGSGTTVDNDASPGEDITLVNSPSWATGPTLSAKSYTNTFCFDQVDASGCDAEEVSTGGTPDIVSSDLEIVNDGAVTQVVGVRFYQVAIPAGATIQAAYLRFVGDESQSTGTENADIYGEDVDSAAAFTTGANNVTGRTKTTAKVDWDGIAATVPGTIATTPDISAIVQEIIDRAGWAINNNMAFLIVPGGSNATRTFESYDGQEYSAPMLHVEYTTTAGPANVKTWNGLALSSVKTINGLAIASVKSINGIT